MLFEVFFMMTPIKGRRRNEFVRQEKLFQVFNKLEDACSAL